MLTILIKELDVDTSLSATLRVFGTRPDDLARQAQHLWLIDRRQQQGHPLAHANLIAITNRPTLLGDRI